MKKSLDRLIKYLQQGGSAPLNGLDPTAQEEYDKIQNRRANFTEIGASLSGVNLKSKAIGNRKGQISEVGAAALGIASQAVTQGVNMIDQATMGDKNFGAQSAAIDAGVHAASGALMQSGNPFAIAAGAALEGVNFLTKAGGQTVQGFDVDINNSSYGNLGHMESSSSRDFGAMIGLGGLNSAKMDRKLAKRNEQARMAMKAASISEDQSFEQEARTNSISNVVLQNQQALSGGIDTNLLGS